MAEGIAQLTAGGVLAVLLIREVFTFLAKRKTNGHAERDHAEIGTKLAEVLAKMDAIREDTKAIRHYCHEIINLQSGVKTAAEMLIHKIERWDR